MQLILTQNISGVQRYAIEITRRLNKILPETIFLTPANIIHNEIAVELNAKVIGKHTGHLWEQFDLPLYIRRNYNEKKYILINLANTAPLLIRNNIVTIHDITFIKFPQSYSFLFGSFYRLLIPIIIKRAKLIFTVSRTAKEEILEFFKLDPSFVVVTYNAIDSALTDHKFNEKKHFPETLVKKSVNKYILTISMFNPIKNLISLLRAFDLLELDNVKLVVVGEAYKSFKKIKEIEKYKNHKNVIFLGQINNKEEIMNLYSNAEIFVFPSLYESFGIPPLEAMACDCPVIVSKAGALPEVCGDAAYYINPQDINCIKEAILDVFSNLELRNHLINKGKIQINNFNWDVSAANIINSISKD